MSIVVLKRKSKIYQDTISGKGKLGFALNGTLRNIGEVGTTNLANSVTRTPFRGNVPMGNGGCRSGNLMYGGANRGTCSEAYPVVISNSGSCCVNDPNIIKVSTKNTKGMLAGPRVLGCCKDVVKYPPNPGGQSEYISKIKAATLGICNQDNMNQTGAVSQDTYINSLYLKYNCYPNPIPALQPTPIWINNNSKSCP